MANLNWPGLFQGPEELIAAAQNLTVNWVALGVEQDVRGAHFCAVYLTLDINDSTNARVRLLTRHTSGGVLHVLPILTVAADAVTVQDRYYEFNDDADQSMVLPWELDGTVGFVVVQVQTGVVGANAGQIDAANMTTSY